MIVTFPRFGPVSIAVARLFDFLEIRYVMPENNSSHILKTGSDISPEEMCTPFKYMVGNLKAAYDQGADTAVMAATCGPCRLGEYGQLLMEVMVKSGCTYKWIFLDSPSAIGIKEFIRRAGSLVVCEGTGSAGVSTAKIIRGVLLSIYLIREIDSLWIKAGIRAGYVYDPENIIRLLHHTQMLLEKARNFENSFCVIKKAKREMDEMKRKSSADPVKILITGEIYTSVEKEANSNLEEKLMQLGCSVTRHISVSWWMKNTVMKILVPEFLQGVLFNRKGITCNIGGYGRESVSKILRSRKFDGVIKIMPSGCMPEIVAKAFCEKIREDNHCKILHLVYDEMSGEAGYDTRIEAFTDMLERRKNVLVGDRYRINKHRSGHSK